MTPRDGVLVVDKPPGPTSHDVVDIVRGHAGGMRAGHTGTLDPFASGVLPVCIGRATRLSRFLTSTRKAYSGIIRLGVATDTYDREGRTTFEAPVDHLDVSHVASAAAAFVGVFMQAPPVYSARKSRGKPAHRLVRSGRPVTLKPAKVTVYRFDIERVAFPAVEFSLECAAGTYVRSIAHDLGRALGCGAHLTELRRLAAGRFRIHEAHTLDRIEEKGRGGALDEIVIPMDRMDLGLPTVTVTPSGQAAMCHGRPISRLELAAPAPAGAAGPVRVESESGRLIGIAVPAMSPTENEAFRPDVVLWAETDLPGGTFTPRRRP